jgi:cytochrome oxidase assembly protein ShyY1
MRRGLPLGPTLLVAAAVPAMLAAGVWQLHRLQWKQALLERLATAPQMPVLTRPDLSQRGLDFRRAVAECAPTASPPAIRGGRNLKGQVGYSYIFECAGGRLSLDAGWSPRPDAKPFRLAAAWPGLLREHDGPHYVLIASKAIPPLEPSAPPTIDEVPNSHLSYAVQWFLFATVMLVIYGVYVARLTKAPPPSTGEGLGERVTPPDA